MYPEETKEDYVSNYFASDFILPEQLTMWKFRFNGWIDSMHAGEWCRPNSLILIGPSRCGKTEWARSLGKHMYFNNLLNLDDWDESADYIILDDFSPDITKFLPSWKCFFGGQKQFTLTDKYRGKRVELRFASFFFARLRFARWRITKCCISPGCFSPGCVSISGVLHINK